MYKSKIFRWWLITYNNPPQDWRTALSELGADYSIGQLECGESGNVHIQAVLWFRVGKSGGWSKKLPIWSKGIDSQDAVARCEAYCQKTQSRLDGPFSYGTAPYQRSSKKDWKKAFDYAKAGQFDDIDPSIIIAHYLNLKRIHADYGTSSSSEKPRGIWIFGQPGSGKSYLARAGFSTHTGDISWSGGKSLYIKDQSKWWDGYMGESEVLLDDLDTPVLSHYLKIWADRYECSGEFKGGKTKLRHTHFIITSNYTPSELWPGDGVLRMAVARRFRFINVETLILTRKIHVYNEFGVYS